MLKTLIRDYPHIHIAIGLVGNGLFVVGSVLFFKAFEAWYTQAVWCFVSGSLLMWVGAAGKAVIELERARDRRRRKAGG